MNYNEALSRTITLNKYAAEFNLGKIKYIVVPFMEEEMKLFLDDYSKKEDSQPEPDCKAYSSDGNFVVYRMDIDSSVLKDSAKHQEF